MASGDGEEECQISRLRLRLFQDYKRTHGSTYGLAMVPIVQQDTHSYGSHSSQDSQIAQVLFTRHERGGKGKSAKRERV